MSHVSLLSGNWRNNQAAVTSWDQPSQPGDKAYFRPFCCGHTGHLDNHSIGRLDTRVCQTWSGHPECPTLLGHHLHHSISLSPNQTEAEPPGCRPQTVVIMSEISTRDKERRGEGGRGAPFIVRARPGTGQPPLNMTILTLTVLLLPLCRGPGVKCAFESFLA